VTVALENDAEAPALGEGGWGAGKLKSRLIYVTVGTGIGGGIILDGQLYREADMAHPEISHPVRIPVIAFGQDTVALSPAGRTKSPRQSD
jgi:predicted NBD/HSP70 family sugar kinase